MKYKIIASVIILVIIAFALVVGSHRTNADNDYSGDNSSDDGTTSVQQ